MKREETLSQIVKMIVSGEIPKEIYNKYLSMTPIGFMNYDKLLNYLNKDKTEIYIDSEDMEERYCEGLYQDYLEKENQELKKQLENCYCNRTDCSSRIKDSKKYDSLVQRVEKQQKEFINWLEDEIKECDAYSKFMERKLQELKPRGSGKIYIANEIMKSETAKECYKNSLSKYKEIIGVKNE